MTKITPKLVLPYFGQRKVERLYFCGMKLTLSLRFICILVALSACGTRGSQNATNIKPIEGREQKTTTMTVEIWSDFVCPFCYIGKRKFENALQQFEFRDSIEIVWKSYQLNPNQKTEADKNAIQSLSEAKGISLDEAKNLSQYVTEMAKTVGLEYNFEKTVTVNTANAHRFLHLAKAMGKQKEAEELLFAAYFIEGKNIDDVAVLQAIGNKIGLSEARVAEVFQSAEYQDAVERDIYESRQIGVQGVPFFVFDNKYGVSGAQDAEVFLKTLQKAFDERKK